MIFAQVVPSLWKRRTEVIGEVYDEFAPFNRRQDFSYDGLEGSMAAKALAAAFKLAGPSPTRESFAAALHNATLGINGLTVACKKPDHLGLSFVDRALAPRESKFRH